MDLLIRANVSVEVCHVAEEGEPSPGQSPSKKRKRTAKKALKPNFLVSDTEDELRYDSAKDDEEFTPYKPKDSLTIAWPPTPTPKKRRKLVQ
jgi:hypothetical protein